MITPQTLQLYNENYGKLVTQIQSDLAQWKILTLDEHTYLTNISFSTITYMDSDIYLKNVRQNDFHFYMSEKET